MHRAEADVWAVMTGIGRGQSQRELRDLLASPADFCIASGFAGSLKTHPVGSIVVARRTTTETEDAIITSDSRLVDLAVHCGARPIDFLYTAKAVVNSSSERRRLSKTADAVDMESFPILAEAHRAGVPAVAIRVISDSAERALPMDFNRFVNEQGELAWLPMLAAVAAQPLRLAEIVRFGIKSFSTAHTMTCFLERYVKSLTSTKVHGLLYGTATR